MIGSRQKFLAENCSELNIQLDNQPISRVEHAKSLGLIIDDRLSWSNHISELCKKISSAIGALRRIRSLIYQSTAVHIYNVLIQPHFDYCAPVWDGLCSYLCEKLQKLQNRAARVILQANCEVNSSLLLETLKWDQLSLRRRKQKAMMMFKSLKAGIHLKAVFTPLKIGLTEISRSRFKQYKNPTLTTQTNVLGCFVNFLVIFRYIWEEIVFLKRLVKFGEIRNS